MTADADHPSRSRPAVNWRALSWLAPTLLIMAYATVLFARLGQPDRIIFDETYYVDDARSFLALGGVEESFAVHPPVGKWLIAGSIRLVDDSPFGWRASGALAGVAIAVLVWLLARRLLPGWWGPLLALFLVVTDGLLLVQARTSMLDIHLALFVTLGAWLLVVELDRGPPVAPRVVPRLRWLTGVVFGLALATKWSGGLALGAAGLIVIAVEVRRATGVGPRLRRLALGVAVPLMLVPVGTYVLTYVPWMMNYEHTTEGREDCPGAAEADLAGEAVVCDIGALGRLQGLWREHIDIARFHRDLESEHPYRTPAYTWPVMGRPISYYYETCPENPVEAAEPCQVPPGTAAEVLALGNPALWWGFLGLVPLLTGGMRRGERAALVAGTFWLGQYVPWLLVSRTSFFFYMVPVVPFLALGVASAVVRLREASRDWVPWAAGASWGALGAVLAYLLARTPLSAVLAFGAGWILGPLLTDTWLTGRRKRPAATDGESADDAATDDAADDHGAAATPSPARTGPPWAAIGVTLALVVVGLALFAYFLPVWTGLPMEPDALRARWWFDSWI